VLLFLLSFSSSSSSSSLLLLLLLLLLLTSLLSYNEQEKLLIFLHYASLFDNLTKSNVPWIQQASVELPREVLSHVFRQCLLLMVAEIDHSALPLVDNCYFDRTTPQTFAYAPKEFASSPCAPSRCVTSVEGLAMARAVGCVKYLECSAVSGEGLRELLAFLADFGAGEIPLTCDDDGGKKKKKSNKKNEIIGCCVQ
jgi:hypothetical protein